MSVCTEDVIIDWPELAEHEIYAENFLATWVHCSFPRRIFFVVFV